MTPRPIHTPTNKKQIKPAILTIDIGGASGSCTVGFREQNLRRTGTKWRLKGESSGDGMDISRMTIWWALGSDGWAGWAGFYITGVLELPEGIEEGIEPVATVTIEIPAATACGSLVGEETVEFRVAGRSGKWDYRVRSRLPHFTGMTGLPMVPLIIWSTMLPRMLLPTGTL
ncbi:hypothetical protein ACFLW0_04320 [Chloroflexota bacterium]